MKCSLWKTLTSETIMNEVMLDRWLLENIDNAELAWDDDIPTLIDTMPVEELSQEALELLS